MHKPGKQWGTVAAISAALGALLSAQSVSGAAHDSPRVKRILIFGDSLSEGYLLKSSEAWPALLPDKLQQDGLEFEVTNASQSGGTTTGGLARLGPHLKRRVDIFVLELGINDVFRGVAIPDIEHNLQEIINRVRAASPAVQIVIAGMQLSDFTGDPYIRAFSTRAPAAVRFRTNGAGDYRPALTVRPCETSLAIGSRTCQTF